MKAFYLFIIFLFLFISLFIYSIVHVPDDQNIRLSYLIYHKDQNRIYVLCDGEIRPFKTNINPGKGDHQLDSYMAIYSRAEGFTDLCIR